LSSGTLLLGLRAAPRSQRQSTTRKSVNRLRLLARIEIAAKTVVLANKDKRVSNLFHALRNIGGTQLAMMGKAQVGESPHYRTRSHSNAWSIGGTDGGRRNKTTHKTIKIKD
jgi:hypothetical protein